MLSSNRHPPIVKPIRLGYFQEFPEGTFTRKAAPATVVSAVYPPKDTPLENFKEVVRNFLSIPCHLVVFTDPSLAPFVEESRKAFQDRTRVIVLPISEWVSSTKLSPEIGCGEQSQQQCRFWYEKKEFVRRAIELNPFGHDDFVWTDSTLFQDERALRLLRTNYPVAQRIPTDRILVLQTSTFLASESKETTLANGVQLIGGAAAAAGRARVDTRILAANRKLWEIYNEMYEEIFEAYVAAGVAAGNEPSIVTTMALNFKNSISLLELRKIAPEPHTYLALYLGVPTALYEFFRSDWAYQTKYTYERLLKKLSHS